MKNVSENAASKLVVKFDNGVSVRGSYRVAPGGTVVEIFVSDFNGRPLHSRSTIHKGDGVDGFAAVVQDLNDTKKALLGCNVNKFVGEEGMEVVRRIMKTLDTARTYKIAA